MAALSTSLVLALCAGFVGLLGLAVPVPFAPLLFRVWQAWRRPPPG